MGVLRPWHTSESFITRLAPGAEEGVFSRPFGPSRRMDRTTREDQRDIVPAGGSPNQNKTNKNQEKTEKST